MQTLPLLVPPLLPPPPSWYPGHMARFAQNLPALLTRTDVVLEVRDARLPLTSINGNLEGMSQLPGLLLLQVVVIIPHGYAILDNYDHCPIHLPSFASDETQSHKSDHLDISFLP
jgi:hypothetical protein